MLSFPLPSRTGTILIVALEFLITERQLAESSSSSPYFGPSEQTSLSILVPSAGDDHQTSGGAAGSEEETGGQENHQ